jgi:hypothetical protein
MSAADNLNTIPRSPRQWRILAALAALAIFAATLVFRAVGYWLVVEDPPAKAQAIAVLSDGMPVRAREAARLYFQGYAPEIWLTRSAEPGTALAKLGVAYIAEDVYISQVLRHEGVPASAIRVLQPPFENTADEMSTIAGALDARQNRVVMIVTGKVHTRRTRILWHQLAGPPGRAIVRAAQDDSFDAAHWWRNTNDALDVVQEVLGLLDAAVL